MTDRVIRLETKGNGQAAIVYRGPDLGTIGLIRSTLLRLVDQLLTWQDRARERAHLRDLNDHMMKDLGLSRADVDREASKPFWRR